MRAKLSVLRACRRALRPDGRIAFYTIFTPPGLPEADYQRIASLGDPPAVVSRVEQAALLRSAGFVDIEEVNVSEEFLRTARGWYEARQRHASEMRKLEGDAEFAQNQAWRKRRLPAIEAGLLRRSLFVARRR